ncbi:MAG: DNA polymerase III subunit alpha, partial [Actinomycetes bacterium]
LTVAEVVDLIKSMQVRVAARGSGAGSFVTYLLGISAVDPLRHGLLMERFLSPLRRALPDIDIDVESARRTEVYERIIARFGSDRTACVSMMDTYRVRHAIRDVGAALGLPPSEVDAFAKAFPHIRAADARSALRDLPELRNSGLGQLAAQGRLDGMLDLVEALDGLPRHVALHPCGVLLSDATLLDRTPVEASWLGFPMSQFDKDDVEELGLLKLDVLGIRMQSAISHALTEIQRVDAEVIDIDEVPRDDPATFELIRSTHTLGCFQIESPGQRELIGKFAPETFDDLIVDISLFRPGPVKSDMVHPFLRARQGWSEPQYAHPSLIPAVADTYGVVVFHEQVLRIVSIMTGTSLAAADEVRRDLGSIERLPQVRAWFYPAALARGYDLPTVETVWEILRAFGSFGFCKAHAAAFAVPTYQSAWLKAHHPAAFLAGVLTHDPGMYPKRLILDDARTMGIAVLGLDVNESDSTYRVERVEPGDEPPPRILGSDPRPAPETPGVPDARAYGIRLALAEVKGINSAEVDRIICGRPYASLADFWYRAGASRPIVERLILAGGFDSIYGLGSTVPVRRRGRVTRRDLLLQVADLERWTKSGPRQTRASHEVVQEGLQLSFDIGPEQTPISGLPELSAADRVRAELEVLGLDVSHHVVDFYAPLLTDLGVVRAKNLLRSRSQQEVFVAGVKVATQTPPVRSGRRVVFLTLDDSTGPVDATFFDDVQGPYAATVFHSWLLLVRGLVRRTGPRGVSIRATGAWELGAVHQVWAAGGLAAVRDFVDAAEPPQTAPRGRRVLVHPTGFRVSPYADVKPAGAGNDHIPAGRPAPSKLWQSSPGSSGW